MSKKYYTDSGLGGVFTVEIVGVDSDNPNRVRVKVQNPDWPNYEFWRNRDELELVEIRDCVTRKDWQRLSFLSTLSGETGEKARAALETRFGPLTELQEEVLTDLRERGLSIIASDVEQSWRQKRTAYIDIRTPIPGLRRKFDKANKEV